jgi:preprotein translocase subunit YajC
LACIYAPETLAAAQQVVTDQGTVFLKEIHSCPHIEGHGRCPKPFRGYKLFAPCAAFEAVQEKDRTLNATLLLAGSIPPGLVSFLPFVVIIAVFYLLLIRPNQNRQKQWQQMLSNLKPGDKVTTTGGIRGTILSLKDDAIQLRVPPDNIKLEVAKSAIASVTTDEAATK